MNDVIKDQNLKKFISLDGKHCITKALGEVLLNNQELEDNDFFKDEEMLFGLDCALDFVYRILGDHYHPPVFLGGRHCSWLEDFSRMTNIICERHTVNDSQCAWNILKEQLDQGIPVLLEVDKKKIDYWKQLIGHEDYGGHLIVAVAYDEESVYISDQCPITSGRFQKVRIETLMEARSSRLYWKSPENSWYKLKFPSRLPDKKEMIKKSLKWNSERFLTSPEGKAIIGIKGIRMCADQVPEWTNWLNYEIKSSKTDEYVPALGYQLFKVMKIIHGGNIAGGGNFRFFYAQFLKQAASILENEKLLEISQGFIQSAHNWISIFTIINENEISKFHYKNVEKILKNIQSVLYKNADLEEKLFHKIKKNVCQSS